MRRNLAPGCISSEVKLCQRKPLFPSFRDPFFGDPFFSFLFFFLALQRLARLKCNLEPNCKHISGSLCCSHTPLAVSSELQQKKWRRPWCLEPNAQRRFRPKSVRRDGRCECWGEQGKPCFGARNVQENWYPAKGPPGRETQPPHFRIQKSLRMHFKCACDAIPSTSKPTCGFGVLCEHCHGTHFRI